MHVLLHPLRTSQKPTEYRREQEMFAARVAAAERDVRTARVARLRQAVARIVGVARAPRRGTVAGTGRSRPVGA